MIHRLVKSKTASLIFFTCFMVVVHIGQTWADESATTAPRQDAVVQQKDSTGIDQENQDSGKMQENHPSDMKGKSPDEISGMSDEKDRTAISPETMDSPPSEDATGETTPVKDESGTKAEIVVPPVAPVQSSPDATHEAGPQGTGSAEMQSKAVPEQLQQQEALNDLEAKIKELKDQGLITNEEAQRFMEKLRNADEVRLPESEHIKYVKEVARQVAKDIEGSVKSAVKDELKEDILKEARLGNWLTPTLPEWVTKFRFSGDIRLRYQGDYFGSDNAQDVLNPSNPSQILNTTIDRSRLLLRVRLNTFVQVNDQVDAGVTIATGTISNPVSTNTTFGDYLNKETIVLDQAWMRYKPLPELSIWGGRMPNPWFSTDLVWDHNLNFEGVALQFDSQMGRALRSFLTAGAFPIQEVELSAHDKWLYGAQAGLNLKTSSIFSSKLGVAYYYYTNITGVANNPSYPGLTNWTAPGFQQKGNTLFDIDPSSNYLFALASDYHELNLTVMFDVAAFDPVHVTLTGDYVKNLGFNKKEVAARTGNSDPNEYITGYQVSLGVGYQDVTDYGQWRCSISRKYLGADAVLDAFTDSNFHGGGTNCQGYIVEAQMGLARNVWCSLQWYSADEIYGFKLAQDTLQADINVKF